MRKFFIAFLAVLFAFSSWVLFDPAPAEARVMIIANKAKPAGAIGIRHPAILAAIGQVENHFTVNGIPVFDQDAMQEVYAEIEQTSGVDIDVPDNDLIALALRRHAELLVKLEAFKVDAGGSVKGRVVGKMFNVSNGLVLAMGDQFDLNMVASRSSEAVDAAVTSACSKAGFRVGRSLYGTLEKTQPALLARLKSTSGKPRYNVVVKGLSENDNDLVIDIVYEDLGVEEQNINELKVTPGWIELEVITDQNFGKMIRKLKSTLKNENIAVVESFRDTNKVIFVKEGSEKSMGEVKVY